MVEFTELMNEAWGKFEETKWLLPVPVILSLIDYGKVIGVLNLEGPHVGIRFPLPEPTPTLWSFVSLPANAAGSSFSPQTLFVMALFILLGSYLEAGYVGSIRDAVKMTGGSFLDNAGRDFFEFLQFNLMLYAVMVILIVPLMAMPFMFLLAFPAFLIFLYAIYGVPFLISVQRLEFRDALAESIHLAKRGGEYLDYALKYLAIGALISLPLTLVVTNMGLPGLVIGLLLSAPFSLTLSTATVLFFYESWEHDMGVTEIDISGFQ
ncbi:hypothetical protein A3L01_00395 [Thermococcus barossii]|uniref:Glycerophosphoryl diester phosphodiesterase membrane domain-containing protein n=1 Tax=Thermococcus barossii TaxID=54077 RepID=A0A2Z2MNE1_9EURY|nr:hypothetical protein A3L01_00395 [Thermococcus barossii]